MLKPIELQRYLLLPLTGGALPLILCCGLLLTLAVFGGIVGLPLALITLSWFFKYAFAFLDHVLDGGADPPALSVEMLNPIGETRSLLALLIVIGVFFASDSAVYWFGPILAPLLWLTLLATLPAVIGVQGVTGSLLQSLNIARCVRLIRRLGGDYVAILAIVVALVALSIFAMRSAMPYFVRASFATYACLAVFSIIGGILFLRRADLELDAAFAPERVDAASTEIEQRERDRLIDRVYAEWRGGSHITACNTITQLLQESDSPASELEWLYERTAAWPDVRLANQLAQSLIPHLLRDKCTGKLIELLKERLAVDPQFKPATSGELLQCARLARDGGSRPLARMLLQDFESRFPDDPLHAVVSDLREQLER